MGRTPFKGLNECQTFDLILSGAIPIPEDIPRDAVDLIGRLLKVDPAERLGAGSSFDFSADENDIEILKEHPFFAGI